MGVPEGLEAFVAREHPRLVGALTLLLDDAMVAEEVAQEALLRAMSRWERVGRLDSPGGWVHRVAVNLATSQLRRRRLERRARARLGPAPVDRGTEAAADVLAVRAALRRLSPGARRLLVLHHLLDRPTDELAASEGCTQAAVRQRLRRARLALREQLEASSGPHRDHEESIDGR